jgi:hypothetical protein
MDEIVDANGMSAGCAPQGEADTPQEPINAEPVEIVGAAAP